MKEFISSIIIALTITACSSEPNLEEMLVDVSEFTIDTTAIRDGDYVEILGASRNITDELKSNYYVLVVVRSIETGDTVNVLATEFVQESESTITRFMSNTSKMGMLMEAALNNTLEGKNIKDIQPVSFDKVLYDSKYIPIDVRKYPTVTGTLGHFEYEKGVANDEFDEILEDL